MDALARTLRREDGIVTLNRRAFDVLLYLVQNPGKVITRDELLKNIWPDAFVDENSLAQSISVLRRALEEKPGDNSYIVTLPGRGYQFVRPVQVVAPGNPTVVPDATSAAGAGPSGVIFQQQTIRTTVITEENASSGSAALPKASAVRVPKVWKIAVPVLLVALLAAGGLYYRSQKSKRLTEKDTIVIADFANSTGDAVFDDTLKTALSISLRQSPFLNVLPDSEVTKTLRLMTRPAGTKLTPEVARELCQRAGSKAYVPGAIGSLGSEYVLQLKVVNCLSGDTLAEQQVTVASKEKVLEAMGGAASRMRGELGESLASVQKFDIPLRQAATSSLEALKQYSLGERAYREKGSAAAVPYTQRAIELDPNFAMGYNAMGVLYSSMGAEERASEYFAKAFELRERTGERERLRITANYYQYVTGQLDKSAQTLQEVMELFPREAGASLGNVYADQGQYEKAMEVTRQDGRLPRRNDVSVYDNLVNLSLALQRFDEARQVLHDAEARKLDDAILHNARYALAFLGTDTGAMAEQEKWYASKPDYESWGLALGSDTEAYAGRLTKARELTKQARDSAIRADDKESAAIYLADAALQQAAYGNASEARQSATEALKLAPTVQGAESEAALAFAMAGDRTQAASLARDLENRFPLNSQVQSLWLTAVQAQLALDAKNPASALNTLQGASHIELGLIPFANNISCLYPTYLRGDAYLAVGQGAAASAEFQKILDHSGIVWNCWTGAMARLGIARANALQSKTLQGAEASAAHTRALAAYKDFLTLWKDADSDIPILKEAKAEYAKLQ